MYSTLWIITVNRAFIIISLYTQDTAKYRIDHHEDLLQCYIQIKKSSSVCSFCLKLPLAQHKSTVISNKVNVYYKCKYLDENRISEHTQMFSSNAMWETNFAVLAFALLG